MARIWSQVLGIAPQGISTETSFFDLGGHSLKATSLVAYDTRREGIEPYIIAQPEQRETGVTGIELASAVLETAILPLNYTPLILLSFLWLMA